ncbi:hypothetical protein AB0J82_33780 [Asanoa sp. NPDC049518]|uniref:hypothetical protein n=1 Tax=unclassified Asanoa TaxID=2685164 RepID=UPI00342BBDD4
MHNSQPWRFRLSGGTVEVRLDVGRLPAVPARGWAGRVSCGAAVFNLRMALAVLGKPAAVVVQPLDRDRDVVALLLPDDPRPASGAERALCAAIARRHSNRMPFSAEAVPAELRSRLLEAARAEGGWLDLIIGTSAVDALAEVVNAASRVLVTATDAGLAVSMLSRPIEVPAARERLRSALGRHGVPQMVLRIGYGHPGYPSLRRPAASVIDRPA